MGTGGGKKEKTEREKTKKEKTRLLLGGLFSLVVGLLLAWLYQAVTLIEARGSQAPLLHKLHVSVGWNCYEYMAVVVAYGSYFLACFKNGTVMRRLRKIF